MKSHKPEPLTNLNSAVHDDVGMVVVLSSSFPSLLPLLFHGKDTEHDSCKARDRSLHAFASERARFHTFRTPDRGRADRLLPRVSRSVEELGNHVHCRREEPERKHGRTKRQYSKSSGQTWYAMCGTSNAYHIGSE